MTRMMSTEDVRALDTCRGLSVQEVEALFRYGLAMASVAQRLLDGWTPGINTWRRWTTTPDYLEFEPMPDDERAALAVLRGETDG